MEAKVIATARTIAPYVADIKNQFLTCRYAPMSRSGAMVAYMLRGDAQDFFDNVSRVLGAHLDAHAGQAPRQHRISRHRRPVPADKPYPAAFACHHLEMIVSAGG